MESLLFGEQSPKKNALNNNIRHLRKVIPKIIELEGDATGY